MDNYPKLFRFVTVAIMALTGAAMIYQAMIIDLAHGRGVLVKTPDLPAGTAQRCSGRDVVWIGSDRLLVRCSTTLVLLQGKPDVILTPRAYPFFGASR